MRYRFTAWCVCALLGLVGALLATPLRAEEMRYLENEAIKVGVDLDKGGAIAYLAKIDGENLINTHDLGRYVQLSFYSGPKPFGTPHPSYPNWEWNPIGAGDIYGNPSKVLTFRQSPNQLYIKTTPMQWALKNVPGDCVFETWISLDKSAVRVRCRLTNQRTDKRFYPGQDQELPAVYTIGKLHRLFTYDGTEPFTDKPPRQIANVGPPWESWRATEHWAALLDDDDWGVGVFHTGVFRFIGGFHGPPKQGDSKSDSTGYIAPVRQEILDHNIAYNYDYALVVGALKEIRAFATARRPQDPRPDYRFRKDRQHWILRNAKDTGVPSSGSWRVLLEREDPQILSPEVGWQAKDTPQLVIRAAFKTREAQAKIHWSAVGEEGFTEERSLVFPVIPDGRFRTYVVELASSPTYKGYITQLRLDPVSEGKSGDFIDIAYISWR